jgi:hypothetical protein
MEILNFHFDIRIVERVALASNGRTVSAEFLNVGTFFVPAYAVVERNQ